MNKFSNSLLNLTTKQMRLLESGEEIEVKNIQCFHDWNIYYEFRPGNLDGDPDYDQSAFKAFKRPVVDRKKAKVSIRACFDFNRNVSISETLDHFGNNLIVYEEGILSRFSKFSFKEKGFRLAKSYAEKFDGVKHSKESFLKRCLYPNSIVFQDVGRREFKYIVIYFRCAWDEEHGVSAVCLKGKTVHVSPGADLASRSGDDFLSTLADEMDSSS